MRATPRKSRTLLAVSAVLPSPSVLLSAVSVLRMFRSLEFLQAALEGFALSDAFERTATVLKSSATHRQREYRIALARQH